MKLPAILVISVVTLLASIPVTGAQIEPAATADSRIDKPETLSIADPDVRIIDGVQRFEIVQVEDPEDPAGIKRIDKSTYVWERPRNTQWILIRGCGGGGSGAVGSTDYRFGGGGGGGAPIITMLIGPLSMKQYTIVVGAGGTRVGQPFDGPKIYQTNYSIGGNEGGYTTFAGDDYTFRLPPGRAGKKVLGPYDLGGSKLTEALPTTTDVGHGPHGARSGHRGGASLFSAGGSPGLSKAAGQLGAPTNAHNGGGGGGGLGSGGEGGNRDGSAGDGQGFCSGGGGTGSWQPNRRSAAKILSGKGGNGFLEIVPLADISSIEDRIDRLLETVTRFEKGVLKSTQEESQ